jgi:hypothetical protein
MRPHLLPALLALALSSCVGTTGSGIVSFHADAAGPADAVAGQPLAFDTGRGFHVVLTKANLHVGGVYMNRSVPTSGAQDTSCILQGVYVGEVTTGLDVDVLSPAKQPFPTMGDGTSDPAVTGEVWLTGGDVNAPDDTTLIVEVAGTASSFQGGASYPFTAKVTIGSNRQLPVTNPAEPGANPICKRRIVSPIPIALVPSNGGTLLVRIDPRGWFANVDFAQMEQTSNMPPAYVISDDDTTQPGTALFDGIHASTGVYTFEWQP